MAVNDESSESLTGVWHGQYTYPLGMMPPTMFVATLIDSGSSVSGTTHETTREGPKAAVLDGACDGSVVRFVKTYAPASEEFQDVIYNGTLNGDRTEIEGEWTVPGVWQGKFMMIRNRGKAKAASRKARKSLDA